MWKTIKYSTKYAINEIGQVKTIKTGYIHKLHLNYKGYNTLQIKIDNHLRQFFVHRLVAELFIPNPNNYNEVNHLNGIKIDNCYLNLEWCNHQHNMDEAYRLNLVGHLQRDIILEKDNKSYEFKSIKLCAKYLGVTPSYLSHILRGDFTKSDERVYKHRKRRTFNVYYKKDGDQ